MLWGLPPVVAQLSEAELLPGIDGSWSRYESANFELYSNDSESDARSVLHDMEVLRAVFLGERGERERKRIPVTVFAFGKGRDFDFYSRHREDSEVRLAGLYVGRPDRATILLRPSQDRETARKVAFHEYVHHLFRAVESEPPTWFNEGMAELLAGFKIEGGKLTIGHPQIGRLLSLQNERLIPLETLFRSGYGSQYFKSDNHIGLFYAQSWALLHYLRYGKHKFEPAQVERFLAVAGDEARLARTNMKSLFEDCFKIDYDKMEKQLAKYVRRGRYTYGKVPLPDLPPKESYARQALSVDQIRVRLAALALRTSGSAAGTIALLQAGRGDDADPRIYEALGAVAWQKQEFEAAIEYWEQARRLGTTNSAVLRELAQHEWKRWFTRASMDLRLPEETTQELRALLVAALQAEPEMDAAYEMLAWVEACSDSLSAANVNSVQRHFPRMKKKASTLLALALSYERIGQKAQAVDFLRKLPRFEPDEWTLEGAEEALARFEGVPRTMVSLDNVADAQRLGAQGINKSTTRLPSVPVPGDL